MNDQPPSRIAGAATGAQAADAGFALGHALPAALLYRRCDPAELPFDLCSELEEAPGLIGQERALKAIQFGTNIKSHDFNIFVLGPPASGKTTAVKAHLGPKAAEAPTPAD